ncbi:unnamed protein product [Spirodela intermedia]|uniref:Uncharacterized protein n=1 Tax=Spirodela intermedia TaxID=51605 RepID=A0A7I8KSF6_SPIIN|nr:unnamed protein product [Spirodela intermedia]
MHRNPERSGGSLCSVYGLEGSPWTKTKWAISRSSREVLRSMKWVAESSPAAVTRRSGKTATLRWRLVSRRIVLFPTTACSSINRR